MLVRYHVRFSIFHNILALISDSSAHSKIRYDTKICSDTSQTFRSSFPKVENVLLLKMSTFTKIRTLIKSKTITRLYFTIIRLYHYLTGTHDVANGIVPTGHTQMPFTHLAPTGHWVVNVQWPVCFTSGFGLVTVFRGTENYKVRKLCGNIAKQSCRSR